MISSKLRNLIIAKFDNLTAYNNHKSDSDLANALMLVPDEPEYIFGNDTAGGIIWPKSGFCIQWGISGNDTGGSAAIATVPIAFSMMLKCIVWCADNTIPPLAINYYAADKLSNTQLAIDCNNGQYTTRYNYLLICKVA